MTLRDQLQSALGAAYTLERELGGGGMSRVFERWTPTDARPEVIDGTLTWRSAEASTAFTLELPQYFAEVHRDGEAGGGEAI